MFEKKHLHFLSPEDKQAIDAAIKQAENRTSGEIRIFIERRNPLMSALNRAAEIFIKLKMHATKNHNGVLIYIAFQHREFAIYADGGCIAKFAPTFWKAEAKQLGLNFYNKNYTQGLVQCLTTIGDQLQNHFPDTANNKNELPDEIVFGK